MQTELSIEELLRTAELNLKYLKKIKHDDYERSFTEEIDKYKTSSNKEIKIIDDLLINFKGKKSIDEMENFMENSLDLIKVHKLITKTHQDAKVLSDKIYNKKREDFSKGKFSVSLQKMANKFIDMENVIRSAVKNDNLPAYHIKNVEAIKKLINEIISEREQGNLPLEAINNLKTVLEDSHMKLIHSTALMNKQSKSAQNLLNSIEEFGRHASRPVFQIEGSSESTDESKQNLVARSLGNEKDHITRLPKGLGFETLRSLPSNQAPGPSNFAIGGFTLFALAATWYLMRQNAKTKEKPVEEKFNTEELKKISPLFGNENIKIENQNVHFNDFQEELVENIKRFFKDYKNIKTTENDKGLTLNLKNLSAREGKEVFSKFLKEFKDDLNKLAELSQQKRIEEELQIKRKQNEQKKINDLNNSKNIIRISFDKIEEIKNTNGNESKKNKDIDEQTKKIRANLKILDGETLDSKYITILLENSQKLSTLTKDSIDTTAHQAREAKYGVNPSDPSANPASRNATNTARDIARDGGGGEVGRG